MLPMIKNALICFSCVTATIFALAADALSQDKHKTVLQYINFADSREKIVDLTKMVTKKCTGSLQKAVGKNTVLIQFQPEYRNDAEKLIGTLEAVYRQIQSLTDPLEIQDLKLYLVRMENVPANYKIKEVVRGKKFFLYLMPFRTGDDLNPLDCIPIGVCSDIYRTIPHELTHGVLDDLITRTGTRWFDEGLSEYVSVNVHHLSPNFVRNYPQSNLPLVSLHRKEIRSKLLQWGEPVVSKLFLMSQKDIRNQSYMYAAAYQLMDEILSDAKKNGLNDPLGILLTRLKENRAKTGKPANTEEIVSIIQNDLKIDPYSIGELDSETQQDLFDMAISLLEKDGLSSEQKSEALYIIAGFDEIRLPNRWISYLLDQIFQDKTSDAIQRDIAATALVVRFNQEGFDEFVKNYLLNDPRLRGKSLKKVKAELAEQSFRPIPE